MASHRGIVHYLGLHFLMVQLILFGKLGLNIFKVYGPAKMNNG